MRNLPVCTAFLPMGNMQNSSGSIKPSPWEAPLRDILGEKSAVLKQRNQIKIKIFWLKWWFISETYPGSLVWRARHLRRGHPRLWRRAAVGVRRHLRRPPCWFQVTWWDAEQSVSTSIQNHTILKNGKIMLLKPKILWTDIQSEIPELHRDNDLFPGPFWMSSRREIFTA